MAEKKIFWIRIETDKDDVTTCQLVYAQDIEKCLHQVGIADDGIVVHLGSDTVNFDLVDGFYAGLLIGNILSEDDLDYIRPKDNLE